MSTVVTLPYDPLWKPVEWAKKHCPSYITNTMSDKLTELVGDRTQINYYFSDAKDATLFALRWS
jgi:hypothetical protein